MKSNYDYLKSNKKNLNTEIGIYKKNNLSNFILNLLLSNNFQIPNLDNSLILELNRRVNYLEKGFGKKIKKEFNSINNFHNEINFYMQFIVYKSLYFGNKKVGKRINPDILGLIASYI